MNNCDKSFFFWLCFWPQDPSLETGIRTGCIVHELEVRSWASVFLFIYFFLIILEVKSEFFNPSLCVLACWMCMFHLYCVTPCCYTGNNHLLDSIFLQKDEIRISNSPEYVSKVRWLVELQRLLEKLQVSNLNYCFAHPTPPSYVFKCLEVSLRFEKRLKSEAGLYVHTSGNVLMIISEACLPKQVVWTF